MANLEKLFIQVNDEVREMTSEEQEVFLAERAQMNEAYSQVELKAQARISALAKLAALGLTEEEIAAL
jgi:hypothetical protein